MPLFDMPLHELQQYQPTREEMPDFDEFWAATLAYTRNFNLDAHFEPVDHGLRTFSTYDVTFNGYGGQPIKGWFILPASARGLLPCVVEYLGYGGGRGFLTEHLTYAAAGFASLVMDTRGQGSVWSAGATPDLPDGANPSFPGFMTQGILDKNSYYYRRVFADAVRAVEAATSHPQVDSGRIAVAGGSQGGGISIAAAALMRDRVQVALPDVPFLCHFKRGTTITERHPYGEIVGYLKAHRDHIDAAFTTLSYFDGVNLAARATARALFSVGLMDDICPPSTVYAAYNHWAGEKQMRVYPFNNHEGGGGFQDRSKIALLHDLWG
ncbi:MAG: acetylxylan esterase [Chloroflexota bacterium]|nr:acetylxylan esterase [Chloroflexota bacterium]